MAVRVMRGVKTRMREHQGSITLQVRGADPEVAAGALRAAAAEIEATMDTNYVGEPTPTPQGPFILIDAKVVSEHTVATIPDIVARHLVEAGVEDAEIASPPLGGPLHGDVEQGLLEASPNGVVLRLYGQPPPLWAPRRPAHVPDTWLDAAAGWVCEGLDDEAEVRVGVGVMEFSLAAGAVRSFLDEARAADAQGCMVVRVGSSMELRALRGYFHELQPQLALASGGSGLSEEGLVAEAESLAGIGRRLAREAVYAYIDFDPRFMVLTRPRPGGQWGQWLLDEMVDDAFPWQVLSSGHLARLGGPPEGSQPLAGGGRVELRIGEWGSWTWDMEATHQMERDLEAETHGKRGPDLWAAARRANEIRANRVNSRSLRRDPELSTVGRRLLAPCILTREEQSALSRQRIEAARAQQENEQSQ